MLEPPRIVRSDAQRTAVIRLAVPRPEIQNVMGPGMAELVDVVKAQGVGPAGPVFSHHFAMRPDVFDFEIGVPVTAPVAAVGRVRPSRLRAATLLRTVYRGPYEGLGDAWGRFESWIASAGYAPAPDLWECYVAGPEASPDPADWQTELNRPLTR